MKTYTKLIEELEQKIKTLNLENNDIYYVSEQGVKLCKETLDQLRTLVINSVFSSNADEIEFYKKVKPSVVSKLIYFVENFNIESKRPKTGVKAQTKYLNNYTKTLQKYFSNHQEFYHYFKRGATHLDDQYFLSKNATIRLNKEDYQFFTDQQFSTSHCSTVATIIAYEKLIVKLKLEITKLKTGINMSGVYKAFQKEHQLNWTGSKTDLIELIYALHSCGAINNGKSDIKELASACESLFGIDLGDYYRTYSSIRIRKTGRTKFLDLLKDLLVRRMDNTDEKEP
ncbi:RteC domain-containing protein [Seonamhaeicola sp. MEBiC1930]|uniref:RteC domain-containing protein n=1 Tax=Seonamhaeicola sp. MEBiC01930 TaxID=2976768 RepID=UPI00324EEE80